MNYFSIFYRLVLVHIEFFIDFQPFLYIYLPLSATLAVLIEKIVTKSLFYLYSFSAFGQFCYIFTVHYVSWFTVLIFFHRGLSIFCYPAHIRLYSYCVSCFGVSSTWLWVFWVSPATVEVSSALPVSCSCALSVSVEAVALSSVACCSSFFFLRLAANTT